MLVSAMQAGGERKADKQNWDLDSLSGCILQLTALIAESHAPTDLGIPGKILCQIVHACQFDSAAIFLKDGSQLGHKLNASDWSQLQSAVARLDVKTLPLLIKDARRELLTLPSGYRTQLASLCIVPLQAADSQLGLLIAARPEVSAFFPQDLLILQELAQALAQDMHAHNERFDSKLPPEGPSQVLNRYTLIRLLQDMWRDQLALGVVLIDIDGFSALQMANDAMAQTVAQRVAMRLLGDLPVNGVCGAIRDKTFCVAFPQNANHACDDIAVQIYLRMQRHPILINDVPLSVSVSIGSTSSCSADKDVLSLLHRADAALAAAKLNGGNCTVTV